MISKLVFLVKKAIGGVIVMLVGGRMKIVLFNYLYHFIVFDGINCDLFNLNDVYK